MRESCEKSIWTEYAEAGGNHRCLCRVGYEDSICRLKRHLLECRKTSTDAKTYVGKRKIAGGSSAIDLAKTLLGLLGTVTDAKTNFLLKVEPGGSNGICIYIYVFR